MHERTPPMHDETRLLELARRRSHGNERRHFLEVLRNEADPSLVAKKTGLPVATVRGVQSFYDLLDTHRSRSCVGTACWFARGPSEGLRAPGVHCLGRCYEAPYVPEVAAGPIPFRSLVDPPVVLRHVVRDPFAPALSSSERAWEDYDLPAGEVILDALEASGLRGRGGAAYPTAAKWRAAKNTSARERVVVANGDEGDPGSYVDRLLLEESPHAVLAGMLACAKAIDAHIGIVFVRGEYDNAARIVAEAIADARSRRILGNELDVRIVRGAGSYVAGEETALLAAIEGLRAEPRPKPPYPAERGLWGLPTVVQNIETLASIPWLVTHRRLGNTKAVCLSGAVAQPGVVEIRLGTPLREVLEVGGQGPRQGARWTMALIGGPMGRLLTEREFDTRLDYETLPGMGHAGVVVFDESVSPRALAEHLFDFAASESCGTCAPCRIGTAKLAECKSRESLERLLETLELGSLCGFGTGVPRPIRDLLRHFGNDVLR